MLALFRKFANTIVGKLLVGLLTAGMAIWGISNVITHLGTTTVASIGGTDISTQDFQRAYRQQIQLVTQQMGITPTQEQAVAFGLPSIVLQRLASDAAMTRLASTLGLGISDDKYAEMIRNDPSFGGMPSLQKSVFKEVITQAGYTETEYRDLQTGAAVRQQLASGLFAGVPAPQVATDLLNGYTGDSRTISYITLNAQSLPSIPTPTDADLAAYLKDHQADFRTKETRKIDILVLSPETLAAGIQISDADIAAEYERTKADLVTPERRTIKQIVLSTPEIEKAFTEGKAAGTPLAQLLAATSATEDDLGTRAKAEITDPSLAEAAFSLAKDDFVIIEGIGAKRAITVSDIQSGGQISLADARDRIASDLALKQARTEVGDMLDQVEELRAARKPVTEIAERFQLKHQELELTPGGPELVGVEAIPADYRNKVTDAVFKADQGDMGAGLSMGSNRTAWFDLQSVALAHDRTLDEAREAVAAAWTSAETARLVKAEADKVLAAVKAGKSFDDALIEINQIGQLSQPLRRSGDGTTLLDANVAREVFNGGPEHFGSVLNGDGDQVVFQVVSVTPESAPPSADVKTFAEDGLRDTAFASLRSDLTAEQPLRVNQQILSQLVASGSAQ